MGRPSLYKSNYEELKEFNHQARAVHQMSYGKLVGLQHMKLQRTVKNDIENAKQTGEYMTVRERLEMKKKQEEQQRIEEEMRELYDL